MLAWSDVEGILRGGRFYWIATTAADGSPHLVQQWGAWVDEHLYFEGSERTRWARNLARDPRVAFGTQTGTSALFGQGKAEVLPGPERSRVPRDTVQDHRLRCETLQRVGDSLHVLAPRVGG
jgi:nitroimidazol reductase NimA-like FMN-containing flavoprotein (pyridoxamine 5'-phosphate oxidase superfamily)